MKKAIRLLPLVLAVFTLMACAPSNIQSEETLPAGVPEDVVRVSKAAGEGTQKETMSSTQSTYSIPADAPTGVDGGPGVMQTNAVNDKGNYPTDKQIVGEQSGTSICLYEIGDAGLSQLFDTVETADADSIVASMVENGILAEGTKVEAFSAAGGVGTLQLNELKAVYEDAKEEEVVAAVANTFLESLDLSSLKLTAGGKDYGEQVYTDKYDAT